MQKAPRLTDAEIAATLKVGETHPDGLLLWSSFKRDFRGEAFGLQ